MYLGLGLAWCRCWLFLWNGIDLSMRFVYTLLGNFLMYQQPSPGLVCASFILCGLLQYTFPVYAWDRDAVFAEGKIWLQCLLSHRRDKSSTTGYTYTRGRSSSVRISNGTFDFENNLT